MRRPFLPPNRHGLVIDVIAIAANLFLFPFVLSRVGSLFDEAFAENSPGFPTLAGLMLIILAGRLAGLYLKRYPLQSRLEGADETNFPMYFFVLNVGVLVLNSAFVVVLLSSVAAEVGMVETTASGRPKDSLPLMLTGVFLMLVLMIAEIYLLYRISRPLTKAEKELRAKGNWMFDSRGEFVADFGLFAYMMVWQVFYNDTARMLMTPPPNSQDTIEYRIFSAIFVFIVFLIFYVSPRTVFLIEDRKYIGTWLFVFGVYLASVVRY